MLHPPLYRALMEHARQLERRLLAMTLKVKQLEEALASAQAISTTEGLDCYQSHPHQCSYGANGADEVVVLNGADWNVGQGNGEGLLQGWAYEDPYSVQRDIMVCFLAETRVPCDVDGSAGSITDRTTAIPR